LNFVEVERGHDPKVVQGRLTELGQWTKRLERDDVVMFAIEPLSVPLSAEELEAVEGVRRAWVKPKGWPKIAEQPPVVDVVGVTFGGGAHPVLMAGPCSVESEEQIHASAQMVAHSGAKFLRGGCFKPRTSPYSFQGVGRDGLVWMREAASAHGLDVVTEAMAPEQVEDVAQYADMFQIGARNMQNFALLHAVGRAGMPVLLKRGMSATIEEWLMAGEHLADAGASAVIFCERGIRSFDPSTRFMLDLSAVALLVHVHGLPVVVDPSHAAGRKDLIGPLGNASLATGAHGLIVEAHPEPGVACSDAPQQLDAAQLAAVATSWGFGPGALRRRDSA